MTHAHLLAVVAACVAMACPLAACTADDAGPVGVDPSPLRVVPSREPLPRQPATPVDAAVPRSWSISSAGIGPVVVGNELDGLDAHLTAFTVRTTDCDGTPAATWTRRGVPTVQVIADAAGRIVGVSVSGGADAGPLSPRTRSGVGVGSSVGAVQRAFPAAVEFDGGVSATGAPLDSWGIPVGDRWVTFQFDRGGDVVRTVWVGTAPVPPACG